MGDDEGIRWRDEYLHPAEGRLLGDGKSVMVPTFRCGLYVLSELDGIPVATLARSVA